MACLTVIRSMQEIVFLNTHIYVFENDNITIIII